MKKRGLIPTCVGMTVLVLVALLCVQTPAAAQFVSGYNPAVGNSGQSHYIDTVATTATTYSEPFTFECYYPMSELPISIAYKLTNADNRVVTMRLQGTMDGTNYDPVDTLFTKDTVNATWTYLRTDLSHKNYVRYRYQLIGTDSNTTTVVEWYHWCLPKGMGALPDWFDRPPSVAGLARRAMVVAMLREG